MFWMCSMTQGMSIKLPARSRSEELSFCLGSRRRSSEDRNVPRSRRQTHKIPHRRVRLRRAFCNVTPTDLLSPMNHFHFLNHASAGVWKGFLLIFCLNFKSMRLITGHNEHIPWFRYKWEKIQVLNLISLNWNFQIYCEITFEEVEDGRWLRNGSRRRVSEESGVDNYFKRIASLHWESVRKTHICARHRG